MFYQPQINVETRQIVGVEALLRWNHPHLGLRSPSYFLEQAEESRLIEQLSEWVLNRVALDLFSDKDFLKSDIKVSINLSATDIRQKDFPENLVSFTENFGINPKRLTIEITENMFMSDIQAYGFLVRFKRADIRNGQKVILVVLRENGKLWPESSLPR